MIDLTADDLKTGYIYLEKGMSIFRRNLRWTGYSKAARDYHVITADDLASRKADFVRVWPGGYWEFARFRSGTGYSDGFEYFGSYGYWAKEGSATDKVVGEKYVSENHKMVVMAGQPVQEKVATPTSDVNTVYSVDYMDRNHLYLEMTPKRSQLVSDAFGVPPAGPERVIYTVKDLRAAGAKSVTVYSDHSWNVSSDEDRFLPGNRGHGHWVHTDGGAEHYGKIAEVVPLRKLTPKYPSLANQVPAPAFKPIPGDTPSLPLTRQSQIVVPESASWHKTTVKDMAKQLEAGTYANAAGGKQTKLAVRMDLLPMEALLSVGKVLERGSKYGEENWHKTTVQENLNHAMMHLARFRAGETGEAHLSHAACRVLFALWLQIRDTGNLEV